MKLCVCSRCGGTPKTLLRHTAFSIENPTPIIRGRVFCTNCGAERQLICMSDIADTEVMRMLVKVWNDAVEREGGRQ